MNGYKLSNSYLFNNIDSYSTSGTRMTARRYLTMMFYNYAVYKKMANIKYERRVAQVNNMNIVEDDDDDFEEELKEISKLTDYWTDTILDTAAMEAVQRVFDNLNQVTIVHKIYQDEVFKSSENDIIAALESFENEDWYDNEPLKQEIRVIYNNGMPCVRDEDQYRFGF